jgi:hypothetical protein
VSTPTSDPLSAQPGFDLNEARTERDRLAADFSDAAREIARLMRELEFVRTEAKSIYDTCKQIERERDMDRARLAQVQGAIHRLHARNDAQGPDAHGLYGCTGCDDGETWPCPTIQALATAVLAVGPSSVPVEGSGHPPVAVERLREIAADPVRCREWLRGHGLGDAGPGAVLRAVVADLSRQGSGHPQPATEPYDACDAPADDGGYFRCKKPAGHSGDRHHSDFGVGSVTWGYVPSATEGATTNEH